MSLRAAVDGESCIKSRKRNTWQFAPSQRAIKIKTKGTNMQFSQFPDIHEQESTAHS
jgi:hypothetical protein